MRTFFIYNTDTGEVVRTHVADEMLFLTRDDLLVHVRSRADKDKLAVLEVPNVAPGECYQVDLATKSIRKVLAADIRGFGGCILRPNSIVREQPPGITTVYTAVQPKESLL
jgi:hypothetical protein